MKSSTWLHTVGPGLAIAATGVGAGDLMAAMLAGANFGQALIWAIVIGAGLKFALNEGIARWQLATGTSMTEGWCRHFGWPFQIGFMVYLIGWSFIVAWGLMSACGVAAHALLPQLSIPVWGAAHALVALALVWLGRYELFEGAMKTLIGLMVVTLFISVVLIGPDLGATFRALLIPGLPRGSAGATLSLMGGVGGSVTLLSYGYWIREKGWSGPARIGQIRLDLGLGYLLTGLFGVAMLLVAATALGGSAGMPGGSQGLVVCGEVIEKAAALRFGVTTGVVSRLVFLVGVWGAVFTSTLGVWHGVPYLFADYLGTLTAEGPGKDPGTLVKTWPYRGYLLGMVGLPMIPMLFMGINRPIWVIKTYTLTAGLFMPILAASLLWLGSRKKLMGENRNRPLAVFSLSLALLLFAAIAARKLLDLVTG